MSILTVGYDADGNALAYPTIAAAAAAAAEYGDTIEIYYSNARKSTVWFDNINGGSNIAKTINLIGKTSPRVTINTTGTTSWFYATNRAASDGDTMLIEDISFGGGGTASQGILVTDTNATAAITVSRCEFYDLRYANLRMIYLNPLVVKNCIFVGGFMAGIILADILDDRVFLYNNTFVNMERPLLTYGNFAHVARVTLKNNVEIGCTTTLAQHPFTKDANANNKTDYGGTITATGFSTVEKSACGFFDGTSYPLGVVDYRVKTDSVLLGAGVDVGLTSDIDGQAYAGSFPIGASNGVALQDPDYVLTTATPPGDVVLPAVDDVRDGTLYGADSALEGTLTCEPEQVATPEGFALTDPSTCGDLVASITNSADYVLGESIDVYYAGILVGSFPASAGSGTIGGLVNDVEIPLYAKARLSGYLDSASSNSYSATPTSPALTAPSEPDLSATDNGDGTVTVSVSGADSSTSNAVYTQAFGSDTWTLKTTITENGSDDIALSSGAYWAKVVSTSLGGESTGQIIYFSATDGTEPIVKRVADAISNMISALALLDYNDDAITVISFESQPEDTDIDSCSIFVWPVDRESTASPSGINSRKITIAVDMIQHVDSDAMRRHNRKTMQTIEDTFLGANVLSITGGVAYVTGIESGEIEEYLQESGTFQRLPARIATIARTAR